MRRKGSGGFAAGAQVAITRTNRPRLLDSLVVLFNLKCSGRVRVVDADHVLFLGGASTLCKIGLAPLFSCAHGPPKRERGGGVREIIYRSARCWRGLGRDQAGQIIQDSSRLFRSVKVGRSTRRGQSRPVRAATVFGDFARAVRSDLVGAPMMAADRRAAEKPSRITPAPPA